MPIRDELEEYFLTVTLYNDRDQGIGYQELSIKTQFNKSIDLLKDILFSFTEYYELYPELTEICNIHYHVLMTVKKCNKTKMFAAVNRMQRRFGRSINILLPTKLGKDWCYYHDYLSIYDKASMAYYNKHNTIQDIELILSLPIDTIPIKRPPQVIPFTMKYLKELKELHKVTDKLGFNPVLNTWLNFKRE